MRSAIAELERNLIVERVRTDMRRARLEGRHIGLQPVAVDREASTGNAAKARACVRSLAVIASRRLLSGAFSAHRLTKTPRDKRGLKTLLVNPT